MTAAVGRVLGWFFRPPAMPPVDLPLPARAVPAVRRTIAQAFEMAYHRGVLDGFIVGALLALILVLPRLRGDRGPREV